MKIKTSLPSIPFVDAEALDCVREAQKQHEETLRAFGAAQAPFAGALALARREHEALGLSSVARGMLDGIGRAADLDAMFQLMKGAGLSAASMGFTQELAKMALPTPPLLGVASELFETLAREQTLRQEAFLRLNNDLQEMLGASRATLGYLDVVASVQRDYEKVIGSMESLFRDWDGALGFPPFPLWVPDLDEEEDEEVEEASIASREVLARSGWLLLKVADDTANKFVATSRNGPRALDSECVAYYSANNGKRWRRLRDRLLESERFAPYGDEIGEAVRSYDEGRYRLIAGTLIVILDGFVSSQLGLHAIDAHLYAAVLRQRTRPPAPGTKRSLEWRATDAFFGETFKRVPFSSEAPPVFNRAWMAHGRKMLTTRADALRCFVALDVLADVVHRFVLSVNAPKESRGDK